MNVSAADRPGYLIKRAQDLLHSAMAAALRPVSLSVPEYAALNGLVVEPGSSNADLARRAFVTPQSMHKVLSDLEERGLVVRRPHPHHARVLQAHLTALGQRRFAAAAAAVDEVERQMLAGLPMPSQRALVAALGSCVASLIAFADGGRDDSA